MPRSGCTDHRQHPEHRDAGFPSVALQAGERLAGNANQPFYTTPVPGNWGQVTIMHQLGLAIGLKQAMRIIRTADLSTD